MHKILMHLLVLQHGFVSGKFLETVSAGVHVFSSVLLSVCGEFHGKLKSFETKFAHMFFNRM